jgi:hypothetical protein
MAFQVDRRDRAARSAALCWLREQLSWEVRLGELRHGFAGVPADEVADRRTPPQPSARRPDRMSAAS